jgi:uncharacterized protein (DUF4213/DUF364 family)
MEILDDLLSSLPGDLPLRTVLIGLHWVVVCSRGCGLAATLTTGRPHAHGRLRDVGRLHLKSALELAGYARSENPLEAGLGVAAINSLLDVDESRAIAVNAAQVLLERGVDRNVALVGHFPFVPELRSKARQLWVIEMDPVEGDYPAEAASDLIPRADLVAITGSALINHTLDGLLALCQPGVPVMILGPSTPLSPVLFDHGATILSGARVVDEGAVLRTVGQGASFPQVEGIKLLTITRT